MTNQHPLTDHMLKQIQSENPTRIYGTQAMLAAYDLGRDEQLEQVMKWLDENLTNYSDADYLGDGRYHRNYCEPLHKLEGDLKKAMRPQEDN